MDLSVALSSTVLRCAIKHGMRYDANANQLNQSNLPAKARVLQTWAVFSKASGIAAASRFSGRFSGIENGTVGVDSGTGKTGNTKNQNGLQVVLKSISRGGANNRLAKRSVA